jgi:hypothetical protein
MTSDIWLADVLRAWREVGAETDEMRALVAELLGFDLRTARLQASVAKTAVEPEGGVPLPRSSAAIQTPDVGPLPETKLAEQETPVILPISVLESPDADAPASTESQPRWVTAAVPLDDERPDHVTFTPPHEPLFESRWTRAIIGAICGTRAQDGPLDLDAVVERLGRCEALTDVPRELVTTLRRGIQLLVDHGESMMPFMRDVDDLSRRIVEIVGRDRTQVWRFAGCPIHGAGPEGPSTWSTPYFPPPPGTPVVVLTDLGLTRGAITRDGATQREWLTFARLLADAGCPAIAVVPQSPSPRMARLSRVFRILRWDRPTAVAQARRVAAGEQV